MLNPWHSSLRRTAPTGRAPCCPAATAISDQRTDPLGSILSVRSRAGDWKYIPANTDTASGIGRGADPRDQRFAEAAVPAPLLFNLAQDPAETTNLAAKHPAKLKELAALLDSIRAAPPR